MAVSGCGVEHHCELATNWNENSLKSRGTSYSRIDMRPLSRKSWSRRVEMPLPEVMEQTRRNAAQFVWHDIPSIEGLERCRRNAMQAFLADYDQGTIQRRYVEPKLPTLPFADASLDLALCSHFLFLYSDQLSESFHIQAIREMCRVATEVRVFPLVALDALPSRYTDSVVVQLQAGGFGVAIERVPYEFQRGGNQMIRIRGNPT